MTREQAVARILAAWSEVDPNLAAGQWSFSQKLVVALEALDLINLIEPGNEAERTPRFSVTDPAVESELRSELSHSVDYIGKRDRT
jgi:hypothetical protein